MGAVSSRKQSSRVPVSGLVAVNQRCRFTDFFTKLEDSPPGISALPETLYPSTDNATSITDRPKAPNGSFVVRNSATARPAFGRLEPRRDPAVFSSGLDAFPHTVNLARIGRIRSVDWRVAKWYREHCVF